jgi:hypothetical protein
MNQTLQSTQPSGSGGKNIGIPLRFGNLDGIWVTRHRRFDACLPASAGSSHCFRCPGIQFNLNRFCRLGSARNRFHICRNQVFAVKQKCGGFENS